MTDHRTLIDDLEAGRCSKEAVVALLNLRGEAQQDLFARARAIRKRELGDYVTLRGVIEISNYCQKGCQYCAIRAQNKPLSRYRETLEEIVDVAEGIREAGIGIAFLQGGQDPKTDAMVEEAIRKLKGMGFELLLNLGEKSPEQYRRWAEAGADSYILKFESSNPDIYQRITESPLAPREACMRAVKAAGMNLGTGNIVGLPDQTIEDLADDVLYAIQLKPDFVSSAPFIPNQDTPLEHVGFGDVDVTLNTMAIWRIALKTCLIPTVSALEKIRKDGQLMGLNAGANVMTINFTPEDKRSKYAIYSKQRFVVSLRHAHDTVARAGMTVREPQAQAALSRKPSALGGMRASVVAMLVGLGLALAAPAPQARAEDAKNMFSHENLMQLLNSDMSILHVGGRDTFNVTPQGRAAGTALYQALTAHDPKFAQDASKIWDEIVPKENYGGEYTTLQWFARYYTASDAERAQLIKDPYTNFFFHYYADNDYAVLKEYLKRKYHTDDVGDEETFTGQMRKIFLEDLTLFGNPRREEWEKTSAFIKIIDPKPGEVIADVGSGPGYYSFRLAAGVGPTGKVYAIDSEEPHIKFLGAIKTALNVTNVDSIQSDGRTIGSFEGKVDKVVLCSLYHNVYALTNEDDRTAFLDAIKDKLKDGGRLYLIDNSLVAKGQLPYHGPYIAKELVVAQLEHSGFKLESYHQPILQRYALVFRYEAPKTPAAPK